MTQRWDELSWEDVSSGASCPMCGEQIERQPFWIRVARMGSSTLRLSRDQRFRGACVLTFDARHVTGIEELTTEEHAELAGNLRLVGRALRKTFTPDLINYASLGNFVPHLHWQIIPRYRHDIRWRRPIWVEWSSMSEYIAGAVHLPAEEISEMASELQACLSSLDK